MPKSNLWCHDTLLHILQFLEGPEVVQNCMVVSRKWHQCATSNLLWKRLFDQVFGNSIFEWNVPLDDENDDEKHLEDSNSSVSKKRKATNSTNNKNQWLDNNKHPKKQKVIQELMENHSKEEPQHEQQDEYYYYWYHLFKNHFSMLPLMNREYAKINRLIIIQRKALSNNRFPSFPMCMNFVKLFFN